MYLSQDDMHNLKRIGKNIIRIKMNVKYVKNDDSLYKFINVLMNELSLIENCLQKIFRCCDEVVIDKERYNHDSDSHYQIHNDNGIQSIKKCSYKKDNLNIDLSLSQFNNHNNKQYLYYEQHALTDRGYYYTNNKPHIPSNNIKQITFPLFNDISKHLNFNYEKDIPFIMNSISKIKETSSPKHNSSSNHLHPNTSFHPNEAIGTINAINNKENIITLTLPSEGAPNDSELDKKCLQFINDDECVDDILNLSEIKIKKIINNKN